MPPLLDDRTGYRENCVRIIIEKRLRCVQALGQPRATVEESAGIAKRRESCRRRYSTDLLELGYRCRKEGFGFAITKELEIARQRHAKSRPRAKAPQFRRRSLAGERIVEIKARCDIEHRGGVLRRNRKYRDAVERLAGRDDAAGAEQASRRLQPDDVVEGCRNAAGARRVGAERKADETGGHGDRRARTRAARYVARIERDCAARHRASGCRPGPWQTDRGWFCRPAWRRRKAVAAQPARLPTGYRRKPDTQQWSACRRHRYCPLRQMECRRAAGA